MLPLASFSSQLPAAVGAIAGCMAIFGFLFQVSPALRGKDEAELRRWAALGGCFGLLIGLGVAVSAVTLAI